MRHASGFLALLLLVALPAAGQKIHIDYDGATAFSEYRTFQYRESEHDLRRVNIPLHKHTVTRLTEYAVSGGLEISSDEPDVYFSYYAAYDRDLELTLTDLEYTYGADFSLGSYWEGGVGTRQTSSKPFRFKEGTVVVDVWDRERGVLVWRGMATAAVKKDKGKNAKRLDRALDKLMREWEAMYGGRARAIRKMKAERDSGS